MIEFAATLALMLAVGSVAERVAYRRMLVLRVRGL